MMRIADLKVKLFADGADRAEMLRHYANPLISGFTTNPTLMRKAGISEYEGFARDILPLSRIVRCPSRCFPTSFRKWSARRTRSRAGVGRFT